MDGTLYLYIYLGIVVAVAILIFSTNGRSTFSTFEKAIIIILAPLFLIFGIGYALWLLIGHIRKNGFHNLLPGKKGKAYPLDEDDFKYWAKDYVLDGEEKLRIDEFNKKYNKSLSLDDVYGDGYISRLTPEEIFDCKTYFPHRFGLQPNMPDTPYTTAAIALGKCFATGDFSLLKDIIHEHPYLSLFKREEITGPAILEYFTNWVKRTNDENVPVTITIRWGVNPCRPSLFIQPKGYNRMVLFFRLEEDKIKDIFFGPQHIQDFGMDFNDLNAPTASVDSMGGYIEDDSETLSNHMFCPICGTCSDLLDWYNFHAPLGIHGYQGKFSLCPNCRRVVEVQPNIRVRYEEPQTLAFPHPMPEMTPMFKPFIKGLVTFETNDEQMDFYTDEELQDICKRNLVDYRENGDLEKGNNAAIIYSNSSNSDAAIALFTELAEKGCHNAMINLFSVLWANKEEYKKATDWLKYVEGTQDPSLWCLWNLAVMYFMGEDLKNNPLSKDHPKAKVILNRILDSKSHPHYKDEGDLFAYADKFLKLFDTLNVFALNGQDIHRIITESIIKTTTLKDKGELFNYAKSLSLKDGYKLGLRLADTKTDASGDESYFFVYDKNDVAHELYKSKFNQNKFDASFFNVDNTEMGAWQLYLLMTSPTIMPVFGHGGYILRDFIFSLDDLKKIKPIADKDFSILNVDGLLLPSVVMADDKNYADVYCCYWNDWKGLVREHVRIAFTQDGSAKISQSDEFVFYSYDCGICF